MDLLPCTAAICSSQLSGPAGCPLACLCTLSWLDVRAPAHTCRAFVINPILHLQPT